MPMVGFGTWQLRGSAGYEAVLAALRAGYRHIDTATMYGNEAEVGPRAAGQRAEPQRGVPHHQAAAGQGGPGAADADVPACAPWAPTTLTCGWCTGRPRPGPWCTVWREFLTLRDAGMTRAVGVSNYSLAQIDTLIQATGEAPAVNQIPWSPGLYDARLLAASRDRQVTVEGYSPLKGTNLADPVLAKIAAGHGVTPAQVVLRWHVEHAIPVIPKSAQPARIAANIDLLGFSLTAEEVAGIDRLSRR